MSKAFLSYSRESVEIVQRLATDFDKLGHDAWFDKNLSGGQAWWDEILARIRDSDIFVYALSPESLDSSACNREHAYALSLGKAILPVMVAEVSAALLPPDLATRQYVEYRREDRDEAIDLAKSINNLPPPEPLPDPLPTPPDAPISYLGELAQKLAADSLDSSEQKNLLFEIKSSLGKPESAEDARSLLDKFKERPDLLAVIDKEIDLILADFPDTPESPEPGHSPAEPVDEQPARAQEPGGQPAPATKSGSPVKAGIYVFAVIIALAITISVYIWGGRGTVTKPLNLKNGWVNYAGDYKVAGYSRHEDLCIVSGLIKNGTWGVLAELPEECRPGGQLIFNLNNHNKTARVDVLPNGEIKWVDGGQDRGWISLDGIVFSVAAGKPLDMTNGWANYGGAYRTARYSRHEDLCIVSGLIRGRNWGALAMLPDECRPDGQLIFNLNNHTKTARVDVLTNGEIRWVDGGQDHGWISLDGIVFSVAAGKPLDLTNGWANYGGAYRTARYSRHEDLCIVSGLIRGTNWGELAMLPDECKPGGRMIFNQNNHAKTARVDVLSSGEIRWVAGGRDHYWISLDGTVFTTR